MKICNHVTANCFVPTGPWKEACPHAVEHGETIDCLGTQCQRFAIPDVNGDLPRNQLIFIKHVEM